MNSRLFYTKLTWDADGQLTQMQRCRGVGVSPASNNDGEATILSTRTHLWNENGQLALFISDDQAGYYGYDGNGERVYKLTGYVHKESYNAGDEMTHAYMNDVVLYVNPYFIVTPKGYTKHYYNGSQRLASVVGDISALPDSIVANASERLDNKLAEEYLQTFTNSDTLLNVSVDYEPNMLLPILNKEKSQDNYVLAENTYYYHADHLGSMSWITDGNGDLVEHIRYLPYGEEWYHKKFNESDYVERFKFTGKERDEESGYDYFGARYYEAGLLTGWLSVDPLAGKYPSTSPYMYCIGNSLRNIDPTGEDVWELDGSGNVMTWEKNTSKDEFRMNDQSLTFDYGTVTGYEEKNGTTRFKFGDESSGAETFKFFADNSCVEYELITSDAESRVVTQHEERSVSGWEDMQDMVEKGMTIKSFTHNHPNNHFPSGFGGSKSKGDKFAAGAKDKYLNYFVEHYLYQPGNECIIPYDKEQTTYLFIPWKNVFTSSKKRK